MVGSHTEDEYRKNTKSDRRPIRKKRKKGRLRKRWYNNVMGDLESIDVEQCTTKELDQKFHPEFPEILSFG